MPSRRHHQLCPVCHDVPIHSCPLNLCAQHCFVTCRDNHGEANGRRNDSRFEENTSTHRNRGNEARNETRMEQRYRRDDQSTSNRRRSPRENQRGRFYSSTRRRERSDSNRRTEDRFERQERSSRQRRNEDRRQRRTLYRRVTRTSSIVVDLSSDADIRIDQLAFINQLVFQIIEQLNRSSERKIAQERIVTQKIDNANENVMENETCMICLEEGRLCKSNCDHFAHKACWRQWLVENYSCPVCRNTEPFGPLE